MVLFISSADLTSLSVSITTLRGGDERLSLLLPLRLDHDLFERERECERERDFDRDLDQSDDDLDLLVDTSFLLIFSKGFCCTPPGPGDLDLDDLRALSSLDLTRERDLDLDSDLE